MRNLTISKIEDFVRARFDEVQNGGDSGFITDDALEIRNAIKQAAVPVIRNIYLIAPNILLEGVEARLRCSVAPLEPKGLYVVTFPVPRGFLRLVSVSHTSWGRCVNSLIAEDSVEYRKQKNRFLRGTPQNPVAAIVHSVSEPGGYKIELYSVPDQDTQKIVFTYIEEPRSFGSDHLWYVQVCDKLEHACLYAITAEIAKFYGDDGRARLFHSQAMQLLNPNSDTERIYPENGEKIKNE